MNNVYLIGMPGCGKSTLGGIISREMNKKFIDLDEYIVETVGESIEEMFEKGEKYFRNKENQCLKSVSEMNDVIVATGGGIVEVADNNEIMKKSGKVIFIDTPTENIIANSSLGGRPLLADNKNKIFDIYKRRYNLYLEFSDVQINNKSSIDAVVTEIIKFVK